MKDKLSTYKKILQKSSEYDLFTPAEKTLIEFCDVDETFRNTSAFATAPILTAYVIWVLQNAVKKNISTLFFLARDGHVMFELAELFCTAWNLPVKCKYFYCSRYSLRLSLLHSNPSYRDNNIFANVSDKEVQKAFDASHRYFEQEFEGVESFAIVDSGWAGTTQECIAQLYTEFFNTPLNTVTGFYFGTLQKCKPEYGEFNAFLFSNLRESYRLSGFSVALFECLCATAHGTTLGYTMKENKWKPVFAEYEQGNGDTPWNATIQIDMCKKYAEYFTKYNHFFVDVYSLKHIAKLLISELMLRPSLLEAKLYGAIPFFDGFTTGAVIPLARKMTKEELTNYTLTGKILTTIQGRRQTFELPIYWTFGCIELSGCSWIQKKNAFALDYIYRLVKR